ncbi:hypothetical protein LX32DRAFT_278701 [Colletotrichum zoysiae]|uniref:Uncharacterized protein n=1 Tax=Colletotrichum zoysiae TaxID=1216348 RepID=A0AAD9LWN3_9PEZI|nr:hypothetical protein LX32DRAFT_278701 [Colletotrichum zoysiae]
MYVGTWYSVLAAYGWILLRTAWWFRCGWMETNGWPGGIYIVHRSQSPLLIDMDSNWFGFWTLPEPQRPTPPPQPRIAMPEQTQRCPVAVSCRNRKRKKFQKGGFACRCWPRSFLNRVCHNLHPVREGRESIREGSKADAVCLPTYLPRPRSEPSKAKQSKAKQGSRACRRIPLPR